MTTVSPTTKAEDGFVPNASSLADLHPLRMPRGGTDRLRFETWDTFKVPGLDNPVKVHLEGRYTIERATPSSPDWVEGSIDIRMRELAVEGRHELLGRVIASVNEEIGLPSGGRVMPGTVYDDQPDEPKLCVMEGYMMFELPDQGMTVFNKQPIPLQHKITHVPPIGQGGGTPQQDFDGIELYRRDDPDGAPAATLLKVETHIGAWLGDGS
jgi:Family of unknown function (DUF6073)